MGTSFTIYKEEGFWAPNWCLEVWFYSLSQRILSRGQLPSWLNDAVAKWMDVASYGWSGCLSGSLERVIPDDDKAELVVSFAGETLREFYQAGEMVPLTTLKALKFDEKYPLRPLVEEWPLEPVTIVGEVFIQLLQGRWRGSHRCVTSRRSRAEIEDDLMGGIFWRFKPPS